MRIPSIYKHLCTVAGGDEPGMDHRLDSHTSRFGGNVFQEGPLLVQQLDTAVRECCAHTSFADT